MSSSKPISAMRVAIVGLGSIGRRHCLNLERLGVARRVAIRRPRPNPLVETPPGVEVVNSRRQALEGGLDAAIICTPTSRHVDDGCWFLEAGVPVLVEKPISHSISDAQGLIEQSRRARIPAAMAYCLRYHPAYMQARTLIANGSIGRVLYAKAWLESYLPSWHPGEDYRQSYAARRELGGGVVPTLDHEIDFLNWSLGPANWSTGRCYTSGALASEASDAAMLIMEHPGAVPAQILLSMCRRNRSRGFEFIGSEATLSYSEPAGHLQLEGDATRTPATVWDGAQYDSNQMYADMLLDFLSCVANKPHTDVASPLADGLAALKIANSCKPNGANA